MAAAAYARQYSNVLLQILLQWLFSFFKAGYSHISALELWLMNLTSTTRWAPWMIDLFALQQIDVRFDVTEASRGSKNDHTRRFRSCYRALSSPITSSPSFCTLLIIAHTGFDFPDRVTVSLPSGVEVTFDLFNCIYNYGRAGISPLQRTRHVTYGATISWKWRGGGVDSASAPCRSVTPGIPPPALPPSLSTGHSGSPLHHPALHLPPPSAHFVVVLEFHRSWTSCSVL